jgi:hypothetical protein
MPKSGSGSLPSNAKVYVQFIKQIILDFEIKSVVDVGHGDWSMWRYYKFENVRYFGIDVSRGLSEKISLKYGNPNRIFKHADGVYTSLPDSDLLICKDVLQHLPNQQVIDFLQKCKKYKYIVLSNDIVCYSFINILKIIVKRMDLMNRAICFISFKNPFYKTYHIGNNYDITAGNGRGLDLEKQPFRESFSQFKIISKMDYFVGKKGITINRMYFLTTVSKKKS